MMSLQKVTESLNGLSGLVKKYFLQWHQLLYWHWRLLPKCKTSCKDASGIRK